MEKLNSNEGLNLKYTEYELNSIGEKLSNKDGHLIDYILDELIKATVIFSFFREHCGEYPNSEPFLKSNEEQKRHLSAYKFSLDLWKSFFEGNIDLAEFILIIHLMLFKDFNPFKTFEPGSFRKDYVLITSNRYTSNQEDMLLTADFVGPDNKDIEKGLKKVSDIINNNSINDLEKSALLHYWITVIHPFDDGNGRIARILSISLLDFLGYKISRGFTIIGESYFIDDKKNEKVYDAGFSKDKLFFRESLKNGMEIDETGKIINIPNINDYFEKLDPTCSVNSFLDILKKLTDKIDYIIEIIDIIETSKIFNNKGKAIILTESIVKQILETFKKQISIGETNIIDIIISDKVIKNSIKNSIDLNRIQKVINNLLKKSKSTKYIKVKLSEKAIRLLQDNGINTVTMVEDHTSDQVNTLLGKNSDDK